MATTSGVVELDALVDFLLLERGEQQADGAQALGVLGAHRGLHVFGDLVLEAHGRLSWKAEKQKPRQVSLARALDRALARASAADAQYSFLGSCMLRTRL